MKHLSLMRGMLSCRWAAGRLQRYLDRDPSGVLPELDVRRLEEHLLTCRRCQGLDMEYQSVSRLLGRLHVYCAPDPVAVDRVLARLERVLDIR